MNKNLLIVEDDLFLGKLTVKKLEMEGFTVTFLNDGSSVHDEAKRLQPAAILLDIIMPNKDGFEALSELKGDDATKKIPVIVLSALSDEKDKKKAKDLGAESFFVKSDVELSDIAKYVKKIAS
ncbi:MAG: response regulator [Pseudomonadales bacterium]|nr:response regulator [Pseudomonadales bacterium]